MGHIENFQLGMSETHRHANAAEQRDEFELLGLRWTLLPEVFAPHHSRSTEAYTRWLPVFEGDSLLEMGCGAGITSVFAALHHCRHVTAVDISAAAVHNTRINAARHGVADRVRALRSDMFEAIDPTERYDVIFWNSSAIPAPPNFTYTRDIEWSIFDRDYASHHAYLTMGTRFLTERGRIFLGFNTNGDLDRLERLASESNLRIRTVESMTTKYHSGTTARFMLLELVPTRSTGEASMA